MYLIKDLEHGVSGKIEYDKLLSIKTAIVNLKDQIVAENPSDFPAEFSSLSMDEDGALVHQNGARLGYTKHSLSQAVSRIKPDGVVGMAGYLAECPPFLRAENFNFWHQEFFGSENGPDRPNDIRLRLVKRNSQVIARAIVSKQYVPVDDLQIVSILGELMPADGKGRFVRGDVKSWYSMFWADKKESIGGSDMFVGVRTVNSETGASGVYITPFYYSTKYGSAIVLDGHRDRKAIGIRHVGEAERHISRRFKKVSESVEEHIERLKAAATDYPMGFDTQEELATAISKYLQLPLDAVLGSIEQLDENPSRLDIASSIASQASGMHVSAAEELESAVGRLIDVSWSTLGRYKHADD